MSALRERIAARRAVYAALRAEPGELGQRIDRELRRELGNAYGREQTARMRRHFARYERFWGRPRQLVFASEIRTLDLEHLVHGEVLEQIAAVTGRPK